MLGDTIKKLRLKKGMTGRELAIYANIDQGHIANLETNRTQDPRMQSLIGLCTGLGVTVEELSSQTDYDEITLELFKKIFPGKYHNMDLLTKEKLILDICENKNIQSIISEYSSHIKKLK